MVATLGVRVERAVVRGVFLVGSVVSLVAVLPISTIVVVIPALGIVGGPAAAGAVGDAVAGGGEARGGNGGETWV